jgi:glycosyltransferase involved in cell wall biosynthesis
MATQRSLRGGKLHVIRVSEYVAPSPGGKEVHVRELCRRQAHKGDCVWLVYRVGGEPDWSFRATPVLKTGRMVRRFPRPLVSSLFLAAAVGRIVRNRREVELAHFHGDYLEALAAGVVRMLGVPSLLTLHGGLSTRVLESVGFLYRLPSHVVAVSPAIAAQLDEVDVRPGRMSIQPSGVDVEIFHPAKHSVEMPPVRVVVASALIHLKDHPTLFEAVRLLQTDGVDVRLEVAGIGPECDRLKRLAPPGTRFHGLLEREALGRLMRRCHLAALASVDAPQAREGTPTFLMEAIACGLPFVATDTGGVRRLASRSHAGLIVPQRRPVEFAAALRRLAEDERLYATFHDAALTFAPDLDWDRVADRLDALMRAIVASGTNRET